MEIDKDFEKEKSLEEEYPYVFSGVWGKINRFLKDGFWLLLIGLFVLYFNDLRLFLFYAFFVILLMNFIDSDFNRWEREIDKQRFLDIRVRLNLIAKKLNIEEKDILDYIEAEKENEEITKDYLESLKVALCEFGETLERIKNK